MNTADHLTTLLARILPRTLVIVVVAIALLGGLSSGLARLGWQMDTFSQGLIVSHGPLMICGFLGTLICLERAVALASRYSWSFAVPIINAMGAFTLLVAPNAPIAKLLLTVGSLGLLLLFILLLCIHPLRYMVIMTCGAICWVLGNLLWSAGQPVYQVVHLWTAFLILTIVGERLELSRVRQLTPKIENALSLAVTLYLTGVLLTVVSLDGGIRLLGFGALLIAVWLLRYDISRRTIYREGLARYIAACLLIGYGWLGIGGVLGMWKGALYAGPDYAALLHVFLLGFVFSMIFGHAPIILPAVSGLHLNYRPIFYGHLILLHSTLAYRIYGYLMMDFTAQKWGGMLNVVAILLFLVLTIIAVIQSNTNPTISSQAAITRKPLVPPSVGNDQMPHSNQQRGRG